MVSYNNNSVLSLFNKSYHIFCFHLIGEKTKANLYQKRFSANAADISTFASDLNANMSDEVMSKALTAIRSRTSLENSSVSGRSLYGHVTSLESRKVYNLELDAAFVKFLLYHTTSAVGAEIALECCLVDYIMRKALLNDVDSLFEQVSN